MPVLPALADHLWQSLLTCAVLWGCTRLARPNSAVVRLALWRIAAAKLLLPYALLFSFGGWLGYPVAHTADPLPAPLVAALGALTPAVAPARATVMSGPLAFAFCALLLFATLAWARVIHHEMRVEKLRVQEEAEREARDPDDQPLGLGFFKAVLFTACAVSVAAVVMLAGAVEDRLWRRDLLIANSLSLRDAVVSMNPAAPGMGLRTRVVASERSVLIRNTSIQDLAALAYGVSHYAVWSDQMFSLDSAPKNQFWLSGPRYDVRVQAPILSPAEFDTYALRKPITKLLAERFGLEIYMDHKCQPPCGRYGVAQTDAAL